MTHGEAESKIDKGAVQSALADKEFVAYLAKSPDRELIDPAKPETIQKQWELFQLKKVVYSNLKEVYATKVKEATGAELDDTNLKNLNDYLDNQAQTSPENLIALAQKIRDFRELPERIEMRKRFIYGLGNEGRLKEMEALLSNVNEENKDRGIVKRIVGFLDKISLDNFEWTDYRATPEDAGRFRKFVQFMGQAAIVAYDDVRLAVMGTATLGKKILEQDVNVRLERRDRTTAPEETEPQDSTKDRAIDYTGAGAVGSLISSLKKIIRVGKETLPKITVKRVGNELATGKLLKEKFELEPDGAGSSLRKIRERLDLITEAKRGRAEMEGELEELRKDIFEKSLMPVELVAEATRAKVLENLNRLIGESARGTGSIEKVLEIRTELDKIVSSKNKLAFELTEDSEIKRINAWANKIIEIRARYALGNAIGKIALKTEDNPLAKLETELAPFITGSKLVQQFFIKELKDLIGSHTLDNSKTTLLKMLMTKLEIDKVQTWVEKTRADIEKTFS